MERHDTLTWLLAMALFVAGTVVVDATTARGAQLAAAAPVPEAQSAAPPEKIEPEAKDEKKESSAGVITPPPTGDEEAVKQPPSAAISDRMPVIAPPGTPGGNPNVQPK